MATIYTTNKTTVGDNTFGHAWYSTRAMLKAGWLLKHSSDGYAKATGNPADPDNCKWGAPATVQGPTAGASIGAQLGKDYLFTGLSGLVSPTNTNSGGSEGNILTITGAANAGNNVNWLITQVVSATSCYARPLVPTAVTSSGTSPPVMTISGHLARTRLFSLRVETVLIGALGTAQIKISLTGAAPFATTVTIPSTGVVEVIDVNGVATGIYLSFAGSISNIDNVWTATTAVANDANTVTWTEKSWITTAYSGITNLAWIVLEGPCTIKIPFTATPTGNFVRGENVTQATTGAQGELISISFDTTTGAGYMVISPRVQGTGTGAEGWGSGFAITGGSGGSATSSALPTRIIREMVFARGAVLASSATYSGALFYQPVSDTTQNASRFGLLAMQSGCTATVWPGAGGTNNTFPTIAYAVFGVGGATTTDVACWINTNYHTNTNTGRLQHFAANCIDRANQSCDGSSLSIIGQPSTNASSTGFLPIFMRLDGGEEGDVEPYAMYGIKNTSSDPNANLFSRARAGEQNVIAGIASDSHLGSLWICMGLRGLTSSVSNVGTVQSAAARGVWMSWWRKDLSSEQFVNCFPTLPYVPLTTISNGNGNNLFPQFANVNCGPSVVNYKDANMATGVDPDRVSTGAQSVLPLLFRTIDLYSQAVTNSRKGYLRWIFITTGISTSTSYDTYSNFSWLQVNYRAASVQVGTPYDLALVMPYDGSTTPIQ